MNCEERGPPSSSICMLVDFCADLTLYSYLSLILVAPAGRAPKSYASVGFGGLLGEARMQRGEARMQRIARKGANPTLA